MELLVVDVDLAHLGLDALARLLLERLLVLLLLDGVALRRDARVGDEACVCVCERQRAAQNRAGQGRKRRESERERDALGSW